jgi:chromosome segregation ATPase
LNKLEGIVKKPVSEVAIYELWAIFFQYVDKPDYTPIINEIAKANRRIKMAQQKILPSSRDEVTRKIISPQEYELAELKSQLSAAQTLINQNNAEAIAAAEQATAAAEQTIAATEQATAAAEQAIATAKQAAAAAKQAIAAAEQAIAALTLANVLAAVKIQHKSTQAQNIKNMSLNGASGEQPG